MKKFRKNNRLIASITLLVISFFISAVSAQKVDESVTVVKGKVIDQNTQKPVSFANVFLVNSGVGTVSNIDGEFIIKVPNSSTSKTITVSFMGYKSVSYALADLKPESNTVVLTPQSVSIQEVIVRTNDPLQLITNALHSVPDNYGSSPYLCTAFYRESVMENKQYVGVAEAVLNIYKSSYKNEYEFDRSKVFKGCKSMDVKHMDTLIFKLRGGEHVAMLLDQAKNPETFLSPEYFSQYDYQPVSFTNIEGRETYVIEFKSKPDAPDAFYQGKIYIDVSSLAIKKVDFNINSDAFEIADKLLIIKKPAKTKVNTTSGTYTVDYRDLNGRWTLNHVRFEVKFKVDKKFHLFHKLYTSTVDLAITDKDTVNVTRFRYNESIKPNDIFIEHVSNYSDPNFWGPYNIIKPEEPIEEAVERISKKMNKLKKS